jgi:exopolysaccharide biosynthesis polyprenyl glycosylphosphotransferase
VTGQEVLESEMNNRASNSNKVVTGLDGLCALALVLLSAVYGNITRIPSGSVRQFLEMRVTLLNVMFAAIFVLTWISCFNALGLYRLEQQSLFRKLKRAAKGGAIMTAVLGLYLLISRTTGPTLRIAGLFFISSLGFETLRLAGGGFIRVRIASRNPRQVVILGSGKRAGIAWRQIRTRYHFTVKLLGFVDDRAVSEMAPDIADRYLGTIDQLSDFLLRNVVDELLIALPTKACYDSIQRAITIAEQVGVEVVYMKDLYVTTLKQRVLDEPELFTDLVARQEHYVATQAIKRLLDVTGSIAGMLLLSPLFLLAAIAVKATSKGPIFFVQERFGHRRRLFRMYKFRSMAENASELMAQLEGQNEAVGPIFKIRLDPRITPVGRILRTSSIDELPQLWNVLLGDMSLVGPRPMTIRDVSLFGEATLMRRFSVKPGITGLWQVSGRSDSNFDQWIKFDFSYIDDWSLGLDFRILARTVTAVLKRSGAA